MPIKIHGKDYTTVAERVNSFRVTHPDWTISTELVSNENDVVIMKATVSNEEGRVIGTGFAEEVRGSTSINKTSALENCETSAIGRALSAIGMAGSDNYASANEVTDAIINQKVKEATDILLRHNNTMRENMASVEYIKTHIAKGQIDSAMEAWRELDEETQKALWLAPTKGGIFTTQERDAMKNYSSGVAA